MNNFRDSLKVNIEPQKKNRNIELIMQYIEKEKEINRTFDEEDGIDINADDYEPSADAILQKIMLMLKYRELRTEQAFLANVYKGDRSRETLETLAELDKDRRIRHNLALTALKGLNIFAEKNNLEPIYKGKVLSEEEIENHSPASYDTRMEMTDAFLEILKDLGEYSIEENSSKKQMMQIITRIDETKRKYGVKEELKHDDGDIKFKDFENDLEY